ncbi:hypothetical protein KJ596_04435, partial [Patescibacteria group bacterium]|nr:hypothetical protein [Patescibacteria group bacterium]MBU1868023.1 hypothetical protein [Patescibacteria group bacterium]
MTSTQAGEMTSDEAGFFIAQLLARQAREAVTTNGWARSSNDRAAYLYGELGPRSTAMHTHHQRVSAFRLSGPHLMTAWGPLLVPELVAEAIAQIVKFATNDQAATHFSLIKRWRARYPDVMEQLVPNYPMSPPWPIIPPLATAFLFKSFGLEEEAQEEVIVALTRWLITGFVVLSDGQIHTTPSHPPTRDRTLRLPLKGAPLKTITELFPAFGRDEDQVRAQVWHRVLGHFNVGTDQIDIAITSAVNAYCAGNWGQRTPEHLESILQRVELISGVPCVLNVTHVANAATLDFLEALRLGKPENQPHLAQIAKFANLAGLLTADRERLANRLWNGSEAQKCGRYLHDEVALL